METGTCSTDVLNTRVPISAKMAFGLAYNTHFLHCFRIITIIITICNMHLHFTTARHIYCIVFDSKYHSHGNQH